MNKIHQHKIKKFFRKHKINELAKETGFQKRQPKKITALNFLLSFFEIFLKKKYSLRAWATELSTMVDGTISFQAIAKRLQFRQLDFVKLIFSKTMEEYLEANIYKSNKKILSHFSQVLLEDSSCIKLAKSLSKSFPGAKNQHKKKSATCRIQFCIDIKLNGFENVTLHPFTENDSSFSDNILFRMKPNALIIRDLGYLVFDVLKKIISQKTFFISRFKTGMSLYDFETEKQINVIKFFKKQDRNGIRQLDLNVKIGSKDKIGVRLVAMKLTSKQVRDRRRKSKRRRRGDIASISQDAKYLMSWNIFITNVVEDILTAEEVYELYSMRWHIEIIFKNWKSNFNIVGILNSCKAENPVKPELLLYLCMSFMVLVYIPKLNHYHKIIYDRHHKHLSPYKFANFVTNQFELLFSEDEETIIDLLTRFHCYDKRKDRVNIYEKIYGCAA